MAIVQALDHVAKAQARLLEQYKDKTGVLGLVAVLAGRAQVIENALWGVLTQRSLAAAAGQQLDNLGKILGMARAQIAGGSNDETYRKWLKARILVNASNGTVPDLDAIFTLISDPGTTIQVVEFAPAAIVIQLAAAAQSQGPALVAIAQLAKAAGVYCTVDYFAAAPAFGFDGNGSGFDTGYFGGSS